MARIAIVGGGMSGVACATRLSSLGHHPVVFDTGKRGVGGRMATRQFEEDDISFDHACQFFTSSDPKFISICHEWQVEPFLLIFQCSDIPFWTAMEFSATGFDTYFPLRSILDTIMCHVVHINALFSFAGGWDHCTLVWKTGDMEG